VSRSRSSRSSQACRPRSRRSSTARTRRPGAKKYGDITLKHGKTDSKAVWEWLKKVQDGDIDTARKNGSVVLFDYKMGEVGRFNFVNAWPSKVSLGALQAAGNDVLLEECVITHEGVSPA
jgi:phage tail-like protein